LTGGELANGVFEMKRPTLALIFGLALLALGGCTYETSDYGPYGYQSSYGVGNCGLSGDCARSFYDSAGWWHDRYW
jgi:hypothetical protein